MPLSDREQKILSDIESRLRAEDPKFARTVGTTTVSSHVRRQFRLAVAAFVLGFLLLIAGVQVHLALGIAGFALMVASAVYGGNMLKRLSQDTDGEGGDLREGLQRYLGDQRDE